MPTLTVAKDITYVDPVTGTPFTIAARIELQATMVQRNTFTLDPASSTLIFENPRLPFSTGKVAYIYILNSGENSAFIALDDNVAAGMCHEIPAGAEFEIFGEDISVSGTDTLTRIFAKGDTTLEVDAFL